MNIEGACTIDDFEVIEIMDDSNPYLVLLGIILAFGMKTVEFLTIDQQIMKYTKAKYKIYFYNKLCGRLIEYEKDQVEHI